MIDEWNLEGLSPKFDNIEAETMISLLAVHKEKSPQNCVLLQYFIDDFAVTTNHLLLRLAAHVQKLDIFRIVFTVFAPLPLLYDLSHD